MIVIQQGSSYMVRVFRHAARFLQNDIEAYIKVNVGVPEGFLQEWIILSF
jgi:hypothetical protein